MFGSKRKRQLLEEINSLYEANTRLIEEIERLREENDSLRKLSRHTDEMYAALCDKYNALYARSSEARDEQLKEQNNQLWRDNYQLRGRLATLQDNLSVLYCHTEPYCHWYEWDDLSRLYRAIDEPVTVLSIDEVHATVKSSSCNGAYHTTLHSCNCQDHMRYPNEPCKHMYALAWQLGLLRETAPRQLARLAEKNENVSDVSKSLGSKERREVLTMLLKCALNLEAPFETKSPFKNQSTNAKMRVFVESELRSMDAMEGHTFEKYCCSLLELIGFADVSVTRKSGDFGADVLATKNYVSYAIQCKRFRDNVGNEAIQQIYAAKEFYRRDVGIVMTNSYFTKSAEAIAAETDVHLWNRDTIERFLMIRWMKNFIIE